MKTKEAYVKDDLMMELGKLEEKSKNLEEISEDCDETEERAVGVLAFLMRVIDRFLGHP